MILFASDFDNTLHFHNKEGEYYKPQDLHAITEFRKSGNAFGLCTGRPLYGFESVKIGLPDMDFLIASTGAVCSDAERKILHEDLLSLDSILALQETYSDECILYLHADGRIVTFVHHPSEYPDQVVCHDSQTLAAKHINGVSVLTPSEEKAEDLRKRISASHPELAVFRNMHWLDIIPAGTTKGSGLLQMKNLYHADLTAGIGDNFNDLALLDAADVSFTFPTSAQEVQRHADYIVNDIAEAMEILNSKYPKH